MTKNCRNFLVFEWNNFFSFKNDFLPFFRSIKFCINFTTIFLHRHGLTHDWRLLNRKLLHEQLVYMIATFIPILHVGANAGNDPIVSSAIYKALSVDTYLR